MFVCFWFPDYIFSAPSTPNWIAWIAPKNFHLTAITGIHKGLGFNPIPTFDWNIVTHVLDPLIAPFHVTINTFFGVLLGGIVIIRMYWANAYHTGYLPINTNSMFNHHGKSFNVSMILGDRGWLEETKYQAYSPVGGEMIRRVDVRQATAHGLRFPKANTSVLALAITPELGSSYQTVCHLDFPVWTRQSQVLTFRCLQHMAAGVSNYRVLFESIYGISKFGGKQKCCLEEYLRLSSPFT